ncbi:glycosyltransferase domain-containing protein [Psychroserpens sp. NJDZ02]|uniref:glycosyltransferase domain-containing protein n=1 Tax=Psychroserpens sp. NJDZ02 TaxID=2570561 RepID=UPI0010A7E878|nr:glycosyltransferase domain-containing protein [Psychroserpens sp. NJDZ02]QCE40280.1 DUF616 domain-containing protein [Psychroserpens sp. NJDZ02]
MKKKIIVYTAIFGDYSALIEQPKLENVEYICYTDRTDYKSKSWKIVQVEKPVKDDNTRSNRYYKILPHKHLNKNCDISVYIDGNILILKDFSSLIEDKMSKAAMACFDHGQNAVDPRYCIYDEYDELMKIAEQLKQFKDIPEVMTKQIEQFKSEGYPENNGLITAPILIRKHFKSNVVELMENWWQIVKTQSKRDQLSFDYVKWKLNFEDLSLIDGDVREGNPWFYTMPHSLNYKSSIIKIKLKRFFSLKR